VGRGLFGTLQAAFLDFSVEVHDLLEDGDKVAARVDITGAHRGELSDRAPCPWCSCRRIDPADGPGKCSTGRLSPTCGPRW
jgi:hypothetical protein